MGVALRQRNIPDLDILVTPAVEELDAADLSDDLLGQDLVAGGLDLNFAVVRHVGWLDWMADTEDFRYGSWVGEAVVDRGGEVSLESNNVVAKFLVVVAAVRRGSGGPSCLLCGVPAGKCKPSELVHQTIAS